MTGFSLASKWKFTFLTALLALMSSLSVSFVVTYLNIETNYFSTNTSLYLNLWPLSYTYIETFVGAGKYPNDFLKFCLSNSSVVTVWSIWLIVNFINTLVTKQYFVIDKVWIISVVMMTLAALNASGNLDKDAGYWGVSIKNSIGFIIIHYALFISIFFFFFGILADSVVYSLRKHRRRGAP